MTLTSAIAASHEVAVRATLLPAGTPIDVVDGAVTLDATAAVRGRADITIVDDGTLGLIPTSPSSPLAPYGNEIRLERGVTHPDLTQELVPLGVFRIDETEVADTGDTLQIRVTGLDRAARIIDARFEEPYQVAAGTNYPQAILETIRDAYPDLAYQFAANSLTTPRLVAEEGADRWEFCQQMATAIGMDLFFDGAGTLILRPAAQVGVSSPVWDIKEGDQGVLISAARRWSRQGAFNRVIATGENTGEGAPVRGVATDLNPLSATYYYGPFGRVPRFYASQFITTTTQAEDAARAILSRELGTTQSIDLGSLVNPALTPGDIVRVTRARAGIDEDHIIDAITIPLTAASVMSARTRATQVT